MMTRRACLSMLTGTVLNATRAPAAQLKPSDSTIVNGGEHAWVLNDSRFPIRPEYVVCPNSLPKHEYSAESILELMRRNGVDKTVIIHVCYYGRDNSYASHCVKTYPDNFAAIGLLVGHRLYSPGDKENPARLERAIKEEHLVGMRLSPRYDPDVVWLNDPVCYPLWKKAEELGAVFNIFLSPHQLSQVADMAKRFPGVNVVVDHFAMMDITRPDSEGIDRILALQRYPNVYIRTYLSNTSKQRVPCRDMWPYLRKVYDQFGPQRMVFTNFHELLIMKESIPFFSAEDKEWILGKTALKLYFKQASSS